MIVLLVVACVIGYIVIGSLFSIFSEQILDEPHDVAVIFGGFWPISSVVLVVCYVVLVIYDLTHWVVRRKWPDG